jgi:hypothetical protein
MVERRRIDWMIVVLLKEWKWIGIVLGAWNLKEISQDLLGFVALLFTNLGAKLGIWQANAPCS